MSVRDVLVVGAGIAGLGLAGALRKRGFQVTVVEKVPTLAPLGAGLLLGANAVACARALGCDLEGCAKPAAEVRITDARGRLIQTTSFASPGMRGLATYVLHRQALHERLLAHAGAPEVRRGVTVTELVPGDDAAFVRFSDGTSGRFDLVVGADGIHSSVRAALLGAEAPETVYAGYTCWRFVCTDPGVASGQEMWGRGLRVGFAPLGDGRLYVFLVADAPAKAAAPVWPDGFRALYAAFGDPVPAILDAATREGAALLHHDLEDLARPVWGRGRVWLIGDAAHAMLPNLGQGAAMALEDAVAVVAALGAPGATPVAAAFAALTSRRAARALGLWRQSRQVGAVAQWKNPLACWTRDTLARLVPAATARKGLEALVGPGIELAATI